MSRQAHHTLAKVTDDIGRRRTFNTAIAAVMELLNAVAKFPQSGAAGSQRGARGARDRGARACRPSFRMSRMPCGARWAIRTALIDEPLAAGRCGGAGAVEVQIVVQVNGKLRAHITVPADADEESVRAAALADPHVQKFVGGAPVRKVIVVRGKLVNVVV